MSPIHAVSGDKSYNPSAIIPPYILTCHCENATKRVQQTIQHCTKERHIKQCYVIKHDRIAHYIIILIIKFFFSLI